MHNIYLGADLGMGALKLFSAGEGLLMPSQIAINGTARVVTMNGLHAARPPLRVEQNGQSFYIGDRAHEWGRPVEAMDYARLAGAPEFNALLLGALARYLDEDAMHGSPLRLTVGLPVEMIRGTDAESNVAQLQRAFKGKHLLRVDDVPHEIEIAEVRATSQAAGALFDYVLDDAGAVSAAAKSQLKHEIGIVSIGFNTVELMVIKDKTVVQRFTAGATVGVRRLLELVNPERLYSLAELDAQLRNNRLDVSSALPLWQREVNGFIETQWGVQWRRFSVILLVGGGALLARDAMLARFSGKAIVPNDPVFSIARGLYKLALSQSHKRGA